MGDPERPPKWVSKSHEKLAAALRAMGHTVSSSTGLAIRRALDTDTYAKGAKISDEEMADLNIRGYPFHPEWNYIVSPGNPGVE